MNEEVMSLRKRLQDLQDSHTTGFVDDAQYAEGRAILERKLVDAVMRAQGPAADTVPAPAAVVARADPAPAPPTARSRWVAWAAAAVLLHGLGFGVYWWAAHRAPVVPSAASPEATAPPQASVNPLPAQTLAASSPAVVVDTAHNVPGSADISGTVSLDPTLAPRAAAGDIVFVYARAVDGPPMPLAVIRKQVKDLPLQFTLDDSMAMWPAARVSAFPRVVVTARVSKSGEGQARAGDLEGHSLPVAAGAHGLQIAITSVVR